MLWKPWRTCFIRLYPVQIVLLLIYEIITYMVRILCGIYGPNFDFMEKTSHRTKIDSCKLKWDVLNVAYIIIILNHITIWFKMEENALVYLCKAKCYMIP